ncbi:hypothetical protein ATO7_12113 [Oceanococcus atlanticus]|uniref:SF3 helicase domain-containing protein n=1 Tax=Oceanococcus atlanticus TaxID=1317117 RepID=A0A1Y1SBN7_9GAMM|nr:phage/plasmid primase, P4 family [Oceanococcus atlanticus]ORE86038.1 hypothetical protein ATO7_12113 [Oceanococcus atlanticus]
MIKLSIQELIENIPDGMKNAKRWVLWCEEYKPGNEKPSKVPYYADGTKRRGTLDAPEDVARFATFDQALVALKSGSYAGLAFALGPDGTGNNWQGIDLDNSSKHPHHASIIEDAPAYIEKSPSGDGWHIIGYGKQFKQFVNHAEGIECYSERRFFTVSGVAEGGEPNACLADTVEQLRAIYAPAKPAQTPPRTPKNDAYRATNDAAMANLAAWVPELYPDAIPQQNGGYRVTSDALDRPLEEDLSFHRDGIKDFGLHDIGDPHEGRRRPIDAVMDAFARRGETIDAAQAKAWLDERLQPPTLSYDECMALAQDLGAESSPDAIQEVVEAARHLPRIAKSKIHKAINKAAGVTLGDIRAVDAGERHKDTTDDLTHAQAIVLQIGGSNLLYANNNAYMYNDAGLWPRIDDRELKQWAANQLSASGEPATATRTAGIADMLKTCLYVRNHEFNVGPAECVNCLNGELVLTGSGAWELKPHKREHYRTSQIAVEYDPNAEAPNFERFLGEIFHGDPDADEKAEFLLAFIGYTLMAHCIYELFLILIGSGANGKSVVLYLLQELIGKTNVCAVQPSQFGNRFQRAHLHAKLANIVTEIKQGELIDDAALKGIVSGEATTVEHKNQPPFELTPYATCWFGTNHMPHTRDFSDALSRRARILTFNNTFTPEKGNADPHLRQKLKAELPGILNLALAAYARAVRDGFKEPSSSRAARMEWQTEADQVAQFVRDQCRPNDSARLTPEQIYTHYKQWARSNSIKNTLAHSPFASRLKRLGYASSPSNGRRVVKGLEINPPETPPIIQ